MTSPRQVFVYMPGSRWENIQGTDHKLAGALGREIEVLWVDPPLPFTASDGARLLPKTAELSEVAPGVTRLRSLSLPGFTRPSLAPTARFILGTTVKRALRRISASPLVTLLSAPTGGFPARIEGKRFLFVTDDWVAGASMMGISPSATESNLKRNLCRADIVAAVSPHLAERLAETYALPAPVTVIPNGCQPPATVPPGVRQRTACLVGQLNERLDLPVLEALQDSGTPVVVIGPRTDRDAETARRLDNFLSAPNVTWLGEVAAQDLPAYLSEQGVGLTPYADTAFNRSSFPLKTLDYLAAGMPVVATDLPAVRWLDTDLVAVGANPSDFASQVQRALLVADDPAGDYLRRSFAGRHTWRARAIQVLELIEGHHP